MCTSCILCIDVAEWTRKSWPNYSHRFALEDLALLAGRRRLSIVQRRPTTRSSRAHSRSWLLTTSLASRKSTCSRMMAPSFTLTIPRFRLRWQPTRLPSLAMLNTNVSHFSSLSQFWLHSLKLFLSSFYCSNYGHVAVDSQPIAVRELGASEGKDSGRFCCWWSRSCWIGRHVARLYVADDRRRRRSPRFGWQFRRAE